MTPTPAETSPEVAAWRSGAGRLLLQPWIDRLSLSLISHHYLPLSRAWAAALESEGDLDAFCAATGGAVRAGAGLRRAIAAVRRAQDTYLAAEADWEAAYFGTGETSQARLSEAQSRRLAAAESLTLARRRFLGAHLKRRFPPVLWQIAGPAEAEARHRDRLQNPATAFPAFDAAEITESESLRRGADVLFWLRFPAGQGDRAWARVARPAGVADPPTFIYLHGITIEAEMLRDSFDPTAPLLHQGVRVIRPEAPWHGRRRLLGYYGGEPLLGGGPLALLGFFRDWVAETAAWIAWARQSSRGPVAVGGISLGALTGQLVLTAARDWPAQQRPDAALLMAGSGDLMAMAYAGALPSALGLRPQLAAAGWDEAALAPWLALLEPQGRPVVPPERILMLLGGADEVAPLDSSLALARAWGLPPENVLLRPRQGHFTLDLGLLPDPGPLFALARLLERL